MFCCFSPVKQQVAILCPVVSVRSSLQAAEEEAALSEVSQRVLLCSAAALHTRMHWVFISHSQATDCVLF